MQADIQLTGLVGGSESPIPRSLIAMVGAVLVMLSACTRPDVSGGASAVNEETSSQAASVPSGQPILLEVYLVEVAKRGLLGTADAVLRAAQGDTSGLIEIPGATGGGLSLDDRFDIAEEKGSLRILAEPRFLTRVGQRVSAQTGFQVPVQTMAGGVVTVQYVNVTMSLSLRTEIEQSGMIKMSTRISKRRPRLDLLRPQTSKSDVSPVIDIVEQSAELLVKDGGTAILGGVFARYNMKGLAPAPELALIVTASAVEL